MSDVDELVRVFVWLRNDVGLTANKLEQPEGRDLLDLLTPTGSGEVGLHVLDELIGKMLDRSHAWAMRDVVGVKVRKHLIPRAVRVALAVGNDDQGAPLKDHGILTARRDWACRDDESAYFMKADARTHNRYEDDGFRVLARLVIAHAENPAFNDSADHELARANQVAPFTPADSIDVNAVPSPTASLPVDEADQTSTAADEEQSNHDHASEPVEPADQAPAGRRIKTHTFIGLVLVAIAIFFPIGYLISKAIGPSSSPATSPSNSVSGTVPSVTASGASSDENSTTLWQPPRQTYSMEGLLAQPVINSITNLPGYGDERNFFMCQDATANGGWKNILRAVDRHTYLCQLLYHNDDSLAGDHLPTSMGGTDVKALLQNTRARVRIPAYGESVRLQADVTADNAYPSKVYDTVVFNSISMPKPVTLTYVPGSARLFTGSVLPSDGAPLKNDAALTSTVGALVGNQQNGIVDQNPGYIQFEVTVTLG